MVNANFFIPPPPPPPPHINMIHSDATDLSQLGAVFTAYRLLLDHSLINQSGVTTDSAC